MDRAPSGGRERISRAVGTLLGLSLLAALILFFVTTPTGVVESASLFGRWFETIDLPFGLRVIDGTHEPRGEEVVRLADPAAPRERPRAEPGSGATPTLDFAQPPTEPAGLPPLEVRVVCYPIDVARVELEELFPTRTGTGFGGDPANAPPTSSEPAAATRKVIERGQLAWAGVSASYAIERALEPGPSFVDTMRVNLTLPDRPCVLFARWPRGAPASKERLAEVVAALRPRD